MAHVTKFDSLLCEACQMAKYNWNTPDQRTTVHPEPMVLRKGHICPRYHFYIDQYISSVTGCLPHKNGKNPGPYFSITRPVM